MKLKNILIVVLVISSTLFLHGCTAILATAGAPGASSDYKKEHWKGNLVGSRFQLIQDVYLYEEKSKIGRFYVYNQRNDFRDNVFHFIKIIPKGTVITVIEMKNPKFDLSYINRAISRYPTNVIGQFINEGELIEASIHSLFISKHANEEYQFFCDPEFLIEIQEN